MTFAELIMTGANGIGKGYDHLDSETLLWEYAAACESYDALRLELENQISSLTKGFAPTDMSEAAMEAVGRILDLYQECNLLLKRITAIRRVVVARISSNAVNRYFGVLKISDLQGDLELQNEAVKHLYSLFASIPGKKGWFHKEKRDGVYGIADLLLANELQKYKNLDLRSSLQSMMDHRFAYLYCAYERDFIDEMRKARARPFEKPTDPGVLEEQRAAFLGGEVVEIGLTDQIEQEQLLIRLRKGATQQDHPVDRKIIQCSADMLEDPDLLDLDDRAIRARLVSRVADETGFTKQGVRRRLIKGTTLPVFKRVFRSEPDDK
jgi:hypothetical protein